jgi:mannose-6-phosphate isomerase-like protein (cupin superfamily)
VTGLVLPPGGGRRLVTPAQEVTFKATGEQGSSVSVFEVVVPPGFDVGAHVHARSQEFFYVLEGELELLAFEPEQRSADSWHLWQSPQGEKAVRAGAGACMFVPSNTPHAFRNAGSQPARMLFTCFPSPDHERYFEEIAQIWSRGAAGVDPAAVEEMRSRYDVAQITPLRYQPPTPAPPQSAPPPSTSLAQPPTAPPSPSTLSAPPPPPSSSVPSVSSVGSSSNFTAGSVVTLSGRKCGACQIFAHPQQMD